VWGGVDVLGGCGFVFGFGCSCFGDFWLGVVVWGVVFVGGGLGVFRLCCGGGGSDYGWCLFFVCGVCV